jgi:multidrug resistance efflux pump
MLIKRLARFALVVVILLLIPVFTVFLTQSNNPGRFTGIVESEGETVGSVEPSRIVSIEVYPGQSVKAGDVLVRLEPTERTMDLAINEARLMDYEHSLLRYRENQMQYRQTLQENIRKYRQLITEAAVELEQEKMNKARDEAELAGYKEELQRLQPLVEKRVVSDVELGTLRPRVRSLELTLQQYEPLIAALQERLDKAREGYNETLEQQQLLENQQNGSDYEAALKKARSTYTQVVTTEPTVLRASKEGVVSRIQHQAGDVVPAGDPIIRIASRSSLYIIGLLPQGTHEALNVGDQMIVMRATQSQQDEQLLIAEVENLEPEVMDLIDPFNPAPRIPLRGRRVRLRVINSEHTLVPGETVYLRSVQGGTFLNELKRCFTPQSGLKPQILFTQSN